MVADVDSASKVYFGEGAPPLAAIHDGMGRAGVRLVRDSVRPQTSRSVGQRIKQNGQNAAMLSQVDVTAMAKDIATQLLQQMIAPNGAFVGMLRQTMRSVLREELKFFVTPVRERVDQVLELQYQAQGRDLYAEEAHGMDRDEQYEDELARQQAAQQEMAAPPTKETGAGREWKLGR